MVVYKQCRVFLEEAAHERNRETQPFRLCAEEAMGDHEFFVFAFCVGTVSPCTQHDKEDYTLEAHLELPWKGWLGNGSNPTKWFPHNVLRGSLCCLGIFLDLISHGRASIFPPGWLVSRCFLSS